MTAKVADTGETESPTIWWVRHGPTHAKGMVGWSDIPADLSDTAALTRLIAYLPAKTPIVSSDLTRTIETADRIGADRDRHPHNPALREMHFGDWEMRPFAEIEAVDPERITAFWSTPGDVAPPGGESWNALSQRVERAVETFASNIGDLIVVAHFGVILSQVQRALNLTAEEAFAQRIEPLSVTRITYGTPRAVDVVNHCP